MVKQVRQTISLSSRSKRKFRPDAHVMILLDHLTSFALLLAGGNRKCDGEYDQTLLWVSVGFVAGALLLICISVLLIELYFTIRRVRRRQLVHRLELSSAEK